MKTTIELARLAGVRDEYKYLERFAALVRSDERKIARNELLTKAMWQRFENEIRVDEREALLDLVDAYAKNNKDLVEAIRARNKDLG